MPASTAPSRRAAARTPDTDEIVRDLLNARKGEWEHIADKSGVSYSWISKFMNDHIPNPGSTTLKKLRAWLEANPATTPARATAASSSSGQPG